MTTASRATGYCGGCARRGTSFKVIAPDTGSAATSYTDETVAAETAYEYQVKAINARGVSEASASANANTPAAPVLRQDDPPVEDDEPQPETAQQQSGGDIIIVDGPGRKLVSRRYVAPDYRTLSDGGRRGAIQFADSPGCL